MSRIEIAGTLTSHACDEFQKVADEVQFQIVVAQVDSKEPEVWQVWHHNGPKTKFKVCPYCGKTPEEILQ